MKLNPLACPHCEGIIIVVTDDGSEIEFKKPEEIIQFLCSKQKKNGKHHSIDVGR